MSGRLVVAAVLLSCLVAAVRAQSAPPANAPAAANAASNKSPATTPVASRPVAKKPAPKTKAAATQQAVAQTGPCRLGVISALGDQFAVQHFGITIFENKESVVPVAGWGLDDLALARVRAATGSDPQVRGINYPRGAFDPFYNPKSRFIPDPSERLPTIVRNITSNANCERYLVVTRSKGELPGTHMTLDGIGTYDQGIGSVLRHSHLFANIWILILDGKTYEAINHPFANFGTHFADSLRLTEDPLTRLDTSLFPDPPETASSSATLRERTRALVAALLDKELPGYLKE
jgi:hypothetical protein